MRLERISWIQARGYFSKKDIVVVPVGSIENHGSHMALGTDSLIPQKIVDMVEPRVDVLFAPVVNYGLCDHHMDFPGTISLGYEGFYGVIHGITESLYRHGARKIIFLNGHGGNDPVLQRVALEINEKGGLCAQINWWQLAAQMNPEWAGGHAGGQETAAMLYIDESLVNFNTAIDDEMKNVSQNLVSTSISQVSFKGYPITMPRLMKNVALSGWSGPDNPKGATKQWGEEMLKAVTDYVVDFIKEMETVILP